MQLGVGALVVAGVAAAGVSFANARPAAPIAPGTARLLPGDAAVTVHRATPVAAADALLRAGDKVRVESGVARLRTADGAIYARAGSELEMAEGAPYIAKGDVLVQGQSFRVGTRAATTVINGIARVRQGLSLEVAIYRGGAVLRTVTETFPLPRLRRAIVAGVGGPASLSIAPLVIDAADPWDRKFLGDAIELDAALSARSRGITSLLTGQGTDLRDKVVATTGWKDQSVLTEQPIGEFVVAAELARAAKLGDEAVYAALELRADGASWGLIALEQGVRSVPTHFAGLDNAVVPTVSTALPGGSTSPTTLPTGTSTIKVPAPTSEPHTAVTVPPAEPTNPVAGLVDGADNLLGGLLGELTGQ